MGTRPATILPALVSTTFSVEGHRVARQLGVVRGVVVRSRNVFLSIGAALQTLVGGRIAAWTTLAEQSRQDAYEEMVRHAAEMGANGVVGVHYDATEIGSGVREVIAYGTAVILDPITPDGR